MFSVWVRADRRPITRRSKIENRIVGVCWHRGLTEIALKDTIVNKICTGGVGIIISSGITRRPLAIMPQSGAIGTEMPVLSW